MIKPAFSIYDASAGSGKTFTLVKEYLKIIFQSPKDDAYKHILAITFTNKAVGEMKSRVLDALAGFAIHPIPEAQQSMLVVLKRETGLSTNQIHEKSKKIIKNIIHNYASFDITTIDKFTHRVIRAFAHDLRLPATFEVSLETDALLQEAVESIIAKAGNDEALTKLLVDFTMEKTDEDKSWDVSLDFLEISKLLVNENYRQELLNFEGKTIDDFIEIKAKFQSELKTLGKDIVGISKTILDQIHHLGLTEKSFNRGVVYNFFKKNANNHFEWNEKVLGYLEEGNRYSQKLTLAEKQAVDSIVDALIAATIKIESLLKKRMLYMAFYKNLTPLSLLNSIGNTLQTIQEEKNILSIAEFNTIIHNEIQNQPAPFIYERLGERYRHFFIDEFQDTSQMQWENLIPLIDNALSSEEISGERGSLMIVGDPKQSIYRWRGGRAEQFIALSKDINPFVNPNKKLFHLDTNYRSFSEIIHFNNAFFKNAACFFDHLDYKNLYENLSYQKTTKKEGGFVSITFVSDDENDTEENALEQAYLKETLKTIKKVKALGFNYNDIAILTRTKKSGIKVAQFLTAENFPIISSETLLINNANEVRVVIQFLRYLKNNNDKEAKSYFLHDLATRFVSKTAVHNFIMDGMKCENDLQFEIWLKQQGIQISFDKLRQKSLYEAVETIINIFVKPNISNAYIQHFLDIVLERDLSQQSGIIDFLNFWEQQSERFSIPSPEGNNAIKILTIHKSKGLEFPVVIFPFAEEDYNRAPKDRLWLDVPDVNINLSRGLVNQNKDLELFNDDSQKVLWQKTQEALLDNLNVLYVALTRASEQLYVISSMKLKKDNTVVENNMATFFIDFLIKKAHFNPNTSTYTFGTPIKITQNKKTSNDLKIIPWLKNTIDPKAIKIATRSAMMWGSKTASKMAFGNVVHEIIAWIHYKDDYALAIQKALDTGLISTQQLPQVTEKINWVLTHPDLNIFFDINHKVWNEQAILLRGQGILKPDRIVENQEGDVYLLDYKTGQKNENHHKQLNQYAFALEQMQKKVVKKIIVYLGETLEIVSVA